jgi:hypothetical protein
MSLKKDIISAEVQIGSNEAQASLTKLAQETSTLANENDRLRISQAKLKALGKESAAEYKQVTEKIKENSSAIKTNNAQMDALRKTIGLTEMTSKQLKTRASELRRELSGMNEAADPARWNKLNTELVATNRQLTTVTSSIGNTRGFMSQFGNSLQSLPGPIGGVIQSIVGMGKALWALVANPIGAVIAAIVASLMLLYKAFTSTDSGANKLQGVLKAISNVMDILIDRAVSYYKMLFALVTFDWEGVKKNAVDAFGGIGKAVADAATEGDRYVQTMDDIEDREAAAQTRMSKMRVEIETLKNSAKDVNKTTRERIDLAQQAMDKEIELNGIEKGFLTEKADAETRNLASMIQNTKLTMDQKEAQLKQWLKVDDKELEALKKKDAAFADFVDKNEGEFQALQKLKAEEFDKDSSFQKETRRLQIELSRFKKELLADDKKAVEENYKKSLEQIDASYNEELALIKNKHLEGKSSEDQYNADLLKAELEFLASKLTVYKAGSKEYLETINKILEKEVEADNTIKDLLLKAETELATAKIQNLQDGLQKEQALESQRWADQKKSLEDRLKNKQNLSAQEIALNNAINKLIEEGEAAHQNKMGVLTGDANIDDLTNNVTAATPIDPNFASLEQQQIFFDARTALIDDQFKREKLLAGKNQSALLAAENWYNSESFKIKSEQIDSEFAVKEKRIGMAQSYLDQLSGVVDQESKLGKALFLFSKALAIGEVWINIAKANAKAVAASPLTAGLPWTAINTGMGVAQTAMIAAQAVGSLVKGKKSGGFTDQYSSDDQVVDYVHANEFVANAKAVRNPTVKPVLDLIDIAQRSGTIGNLNLAAILGSVGRRSGGYDSASNSILTNSTTISNSSEIINQKEQGLLQAISKLNANLEKGIKAKIIYREFEEYKDKIEATRKNANL